MFRVLVFFTASATPWPALTQSYVEQIVPRHQDWIQSCTDSRVALSEEELIIYSIDSVSDTQALMLCLLSEVELISDTRVSDSRDAVPYFSSYDERRLGDSTIPQKMTEILIRTDTKILVVSGANSDYGITSIASISKDLFLVTTGYATDYRVYTVDTKTGEADYLTNGLIEIVDKNIPTFRVNGYKSYFNTGDAFWFNAIIDIEGNFLDIVTPSDGDSIRCMEIEELSQRSFLDLAKVVGPEICIVR